MKHFNLLLHKKVLLFIGVLLTVGMFSSIVPQAHAQVPACTADFQKADCTWDALPGAASYKVTVSDTDTNATVFTQDVPTGSPLTVTFPITQNHTFECLVAAVNSCGTAGTAGQDSALCAGNSSPTSVPTIAPTIASTIAPTAIVIPTSPPAATAVPIQRLPNTGSVTPSILIGIGAGGVILIGSLLMLL